MHSQQPLIRLAEELLMRLRKCLGFRTPTGVIPQRLRRVACGCCALAKTAPFRLLSSPF